MAKMMLNNKQRRELRKEAEAKAARKIAEMDMALMARIQAAVKAETEAEMAAKEKQLEEARKAYSSMSPAYALNVLKSNADKVVKAHSYGAAMRSLGKLRSFTVNDFSAKLEKHVMSFMASKKTGVRKRFIQNLYSQRHVVHTFVLNGNKDAVHMLTTANNSALLRSLEEDYGVIRDGRLLKFEDEENNLQYTAMCKDRYRLHTMAIKVVFANVDNKDAFEKQLRKGQFAVDLDKGTFRAFIEGMALKDGERLFRLGGWTPSGEKASKAMLYSLSAEEIAERHDKAAGYAFSKAYKNGTKIKSLAARYCAISESNSVYAGDLNDFLRRYKRSALVIDAPFDSIVEVAEEVQSELEFSNEGPDGLFVMSGLLTRWLLENATGYKFSYAESVMTNLQARIGLNVVKGFSVSVTERAIALFARKLKERFGKDAHVIGDGDVAIILDSNTCKVPNSANAVKGEMPVYLLDVANTSVGANMSTQVYINLQDMMEKDQLDKEILALIEREVMRRQKNLFADNKYVNNASQIHQVAIAAGGTRALLTRLVRKHMLREYAQMANKIAEKGKIPMGGFSEHATCDPFNSFTNGAVKNVLGFDGNYMECYSAHAERNGIRYGVIKKFPAQGVVEYILVKFLTLNEIEERVDKNLESYTGLDKHEIKYAVMDYMTFLGGGTLMVPASALAKECLAGMDFDYDGVTVYTDDFIVNALKKKLGKYSLRVCAIRYGETKAEVKEKEDIENRTVIGGVSGDFDIFAGLEDLDDDFNNLHEVKEEKPITEKFSYEKLHAEASSGTVWKDVIGITVSASDMAITLDTGFIFEGQKLNDLGVQTIEKIFVGIGKDGSGDYKSIFVGSDKYYDTFVKTVVDDVKSAAEVYLVDKETVQMFIEAVRNTSVKDLTLKGYKKLCFELSFIARALGESAIDILKKGAAVDLGYRMEEVINSKVKKLSSALKDTGVKTNVDSYLSYVVYDQEGYDKEFKVSFAPSLVPYIDFIEGKGKYPHKKDKNGADTDELDLLIIDKFGVLKIKMLRRLEAVINKIGLQFKNMPAISGIEFWFYKAEETYNRVKLELVRETGIDEAKANQKVNGALAVINSIITGCRGFLFDSNVEKDTKHVIRKAIVAELNSCFKGVELSGKEIVQLSAYAYACRYSFDNGIFTGKPAVVSKALNPNFISSNHKISDDDKKKEIKLDNIAYIMFRVFGPLAGYLFGDKLFAELEVSKFMPNDALSFINAIFGEEVKPKYLEFDHNIAVLDVDYDDINETYYLTADGERACNINLPENLDLFSKDIDKVKIVKDNVLDYNGKFMFQKERLVTELTSDISSLTTGTKIEAVVLDRFLDADGKVVALANQLYNAANSLESAFKENFNASDNALGVFKDEEGNRKINYMKQNNSVVGEAGFLPNFYAKNAWDAKLPLWGKYAFYAGNRCVGNTIFNTENKKGIITLAVENIVFLRK